MLDIVERLRRGEGCAEEGGKTCIDMSAAGGCICAISADEIERLRAALEFYGNPDNWKSGGWDHQFRMMSPEPVYSDKGDKARAALGGDA